MTPPPSLPAGAHKQSLSDDPYGFWDAPAVVFLFFVNHMGHYLQDLAKKPSRIIFCYLLFEMNLLFFILRYGEFIACGSLKTFI